MIVFIVNCAHVPKNKNIPQYNKSERINSVRSRFKMEEQVSSENQKLDLNDDDSDSLEEISNDDCEENTNGATMDKHTDLHFSAAFGNIETVQHAFESPDLKIDAENFMGWTPLMMAVRNGRLEVSKFLLKKGADVTRKNKFGVNIFGLSIASGNLELIDAILQHLLKGGVSRNKIQENLSPVALAILYQRTNILKWLIERGFDLNSATWKSNLTPLMFAAAMRNQEILSCLEQRGANKHCKNYMGFNYQAITLWKNGGLYSALQKIQKPIIPIVVTDESMLVSEEKRKKKTSPKRSKAPYKVPNNTPNECSAPNSIPVTKPCQANVNNCHLNVDPAALMQAFKHISSPVLQAPANVGFQDQQKYTFQTSYTMQYPNMPFITSPLTYQTMGGRTVLSPLVLTPSYQQFTNAVGEYPQNTPVAVLSSPQALYQGSPQVFFPPQMSIRTNSYNEYENTSPNYAGFYQLFQSPHNAE